MSIVTLGDRTGTNVAGCEDSRIKSASPAAAAGAGEFIEASKFDVGDHTNFVIRFPNLTNYAGRAIMAARLVLNMTSTEGADYTVSLHRMLVSWVEATVTWNTRDGAVAWTTAGALSNGNDRAAVVSVARLVGAADVGTDVSFTDSQFLTDVQQMANGIVPNVGWGGYVDDAGIGAAAHIFASADHSTAALRPYLELTLADPDYNWRVRQNRPRPFAPGRAR